MGFACSLFKLPLATASIGIRRALLPGLMNPDGNWRNFRYLGNWRNTANNQHENGDNNCYDGPAIEKDVFVFLLCTHCATLYCDVNTVSFGSMVIPSFTLCKPLNTILEFASRPSETIK